MSTCLDTSKKSTNIGMFKLLSRHNDPAYKFIKLFSNLKTLLVGVFLQGVEGGAPGQCFVGVFQILFNRMYDIHDATQLSFRNSGSLGTWCFCYVWILE